MNGKGKCVVARAHPESDSVTDSGTNRCPQGSLGTQTPRKNGTSKIRVWVPRLPTGCAQDESDKKCRKWECSKQCKPLTVFEVDATVSFKRVTRV